MTATAYPLAWPRGRTVSRCELDGVDIGRTLLLEDLAVEFCEYSRGYYGEC